MTRLAMILALLGLAACSQQTASEDQQPDGYVAPSFAPIEFGN